MANIMTDREQHQRYCTRFPAFNSSYCCEFHKQGVVGDVRRCDHGHIMLAYEQMGRTAPMWRTLSPIWTPILFWRARKALANEDMHFETPHRDRTDPTGPVGETL